LSKEVTARDLVPGSAAESGAGLRPLEGAKADHKRPEGAAVAVFGSGSAPAGHTVLDEAECLGRMLAEAGFVLVNGGYGGVMEAASRGARQAGGQVVGVTMELFAPRLTPNRWLTREQRVTDFFPRLQALTAADAFVVLRGGIGTLTEATLTWSLLQTGQIAPRPFVFVGEDWQRLFEAFQATTFITQGDLALATVVADVEEAVALLKVELAPTP
jgi:uncharacterized protein (TIGR00730 family)